MLKISENLIEASADMFIVPNGNSTYKKSAEFSDYFRECMLPKQISIAENNGYIFNENDKPIQVWFVSEEDLHCENMQDHYSRVTINGERFSFRLDYSYLPSVMLKDIKEGEEINITFPVVLTKMYDRNEIPEEDININMNLLLHLTANQSDYRYRRFGNFEDVLQHIA